MPQTRQEIRDSILEDGKQVMLSFSCGKDSIAAWLWMRREYDCEIHPFIFCIVPGLEFVEESLAWYERFFGCRIHRLPSPATYRMWNEFVFQPPGNRSVIMSAGLPSFTADEARDALAENLGTPRMWTANGCRLVDNLARRAAMQRYGAITASRRMFYPIYDMRKEELLRLIVEDGCRLPVDYQLFGRSFDGLDLRYLIPIKKHFPRDFERICELFPMCDMAVWRHEKSLTYARN